MKPQRVQKHHQSKLIQETIQEKFPTTKFIVIHVESSGYNGLNFATIAINDKPVEMQLNSSNHKRGLHVVVINPADGEVEYAQVFDTYKSSEELDAFISEGVPKNYIVVAACKDDCFTMLSQTAK